MNQTGGWRCLLCGQPYVGEPGSDGVLRCPSGHRAYSGYVAESAYLRSRLQWLDDRVRSEDAAPAPEAARAYGVWPAEGSPAGSPGATPLVIRPAAAVRPAPPAPDVGVQTLLLVLGAGLLVVAGIVFAAVVWDQLGALGQVVVMALLTLGCGTLAVRLRYRLPGTAEALAVVAYGLAVIDVVAAPALGLLPEHWADVDRPYLLLAATCGGALGVLLGHRVALEAWVWLGWSTLAVATLLLWCWLHLGPAADQPWPGLTVCVMSLPALAMVAAPEVWRAAEADRAPLTAAGALAGVFAGLCWLVAVSDASRAAFLAAAAALLLTAAAAAVAGRRTGWPPAGAAVLAGVGIGVALLALPDLDAPALGLIAGAAGLALLVGGAAAGLRAEGLLASAAVWAAWAVGYLADTSPSRGADPAVLQLAGLAGVVSVVWFCVAWVERLRPLAWSAAAAGWVGWLMVLPRLDGLPRIPETYFLPLAVLLLAAGLTARRVSAAEAPLGSAAWLAPAATAALVPPAVACWLAPWVADAGTQDRDEAVLRLIAVLGSGVVCVAAGVRLRWAGLLVPAAAALAIAGSAQVWTGLVALPRWVAIATAGALLLLLGARIEWLRREGRRARAYLDDLA